MCGIAGLYNFDGRPVDPAVLDRMVELQHHRGPDDRGLRLFSLREGSSRALASGADRSGRRLEGGIGFARLSILDLSERGHQPMLSDDGQIIIAFNGEIYNAFSFTATLQALGHEFRGTSDTEVLLRLYEQFGLEGMLARINGMFAIALIDLRQRTLTLIRDGTGIKPLVWARAGNTLLFGSEIKSFLAHPDFECRLSEAHLDEYLAFRYCAGDGHLLKGVNQLRPGHYMQFSLDCEPHVRRYYQIPEADSGKTVSGAAALEGLDGVLRTSVRSQLLADVTVGCQLSGGIDSSLTTLFAKGEEGDAIEAFSVIFRDQRYSEEKWIDQAAQVAGVRRNKFAFESDDFFSLLEPATWHLEQPINHPNTLGIYLLARESRPKVKVLLSGEGADELMGGYVRFCYAAMRPKVKPLLPLLSRLPGVGEKWSRNFRPDIHDETDFFILSSMHLQPQHLLAVRPDANLTGLLDTRREIFEEGRGEHLSNCLRYEMQTYMVDLLLRQDRMTMAHSLENRVPFLDRNMIEFVRSLSPSLLVGGALSLQDRRMHNTKMLLKSLARRHFPEEFVYRSKSGFSLPLLDYYRDPRFVALMEERVLPGMRRRGLTDPEPVRNWWRNIDKMPRTLDEAYWVPIMLEIWAQQWLDGLNVTRQAQPAMSG